MREIKATKPVLTTYEDYVQEIKSIWDSGIMTNNGSKVDKFKEVLISYVNSNIDLFVNGHSALLLAIKALNLGGEVITSPFTFVSTTNAIIQSGLIPVFADIDDSYNLDPQKIEELITEKTCAIITPHIFGIPCEVNAIEKIAEKHKLKVIYDGAQAFGTRIEGKSIALYGDITMFSFHAIKIFNSIEGGMLSYKDASLHRSFELLRNFGISYSDMGIDVEECGINAKMNEFQASMGIVNLPKLDEEIEKRKKIAQWYSEQIADIQGITSYEYKDSIDYNYAYFPIKVKKEECGISRDELWIKLKEKGIGTRKLYDKLTCDYLIYSNRGFVRKTDNAERIKKAALDLPIYGTITEADVSYICETLKKYAERS